jgi:predicted nucleic-acid-binding protein
MKNLTGVDTNIIVRLLTRDDLIQAAKADSLFKNHSIFIPDTVFLETEWVLRYAYGFSPTAIYEAFFKLCGLPNVTLSNPNRMRTALEWYSEGMDFADALHLALSQDCRVFYTFDQKLVRKARNRGRCAILEP